MHAESTEANKAFMTKLFSERKLLDDFPDHVDPAVVIHQPAALPFGGTYHGLAELRRIYPEVGKFYDFSRFEHLGVYGDGDTVWSRLKVGVAGTARTLFIAEQFTFKNAKVVEVRIYVSEDS